MGILELRAKRELILRIAAGYGASEVRVFGSVARGEDDPESDVDFLVRLEPGVTLFRHAALTRELSAALGCKVDVISERGLRPRIRDQVMAQAIPL